MWFIYMYSYYIFFEHLASNFSTLFRLTDVYKFQDLVLYSTVNKQNV